MPYFANTVGAAAMMPARSPGIFASPDGHSRVKASPNDDCDMPQLRIGDDLARGWCAASKSCPAQSQRTRTTAAVLTGVHAHGMVNASRALRMGRETS